MSSIKHLVVEKALAFATDAHEGQLRKYTCKPYINHPVAVSKLVASIIDDPDMLAAALLHDTVEDTHITHEDIQHEFGSSIASLVENLTDISKPEDGNRATRKALDLAHIATASPQAKTIKLADLIDNSQSITECNPKFAQVYMKEKQALLQVLKEGDSKLYQQAKKIVDNYQQHHKTVE